jgi:nucleotide-binding universal stress UspA family protein
MRFVGGEGDDMRVLLAVDSIITLDILLNEVSARSWPAGTEVRVLSVVEDADVPYDVWREMGYGTDAVRREMKRRGEQITTLVTARLAQIGMPCEVVIMRGDPAFLISVEAENWPADLILIRAHNRTSLRNRLLGSVANSVLGVAPCAVDVVRPVEGDEVIPVDHPTRILLASDGSESSKEAARAVAHATWPADTQVKVVTVVNPVLHALEKIGLNLGRTERAHQALGEIVQILEETFVAISAEVVAGRPAQQIIDKARVWNADLIVVGADGRRGPQRLFWRSVSEAVANGAHCSVKIVRRRDSSEDDQWARDRVRSLPKVRTVYELAENPDWKKAA